MTSTNSNRDLTKVAYHYDEVRVLVPGTAEWALNQMTLNAKVTRPDWPNHVYLYLSTVGKINKSDSNASGKAVDRFFNRYHDVTDWVIYGEVPSNG